jgi:membrane protease subunit (stomatin/prohibitin family)
MAIIDVVKYQSDDYNLVYKFPSEDLRYGTQLVVNTSQMAFFIKGGEILDEFQSGTHTLKSDNIPILNKLINIPFGGNSPFQAEVWFVNLISFMDLKWGTSAPIQLEDPKYGVIVPIRAFGQYGYKINEPRLFLKTLVGNMSSFSVEKVNDYFKGKVLSMLVSLISSKLTKDNISILEINTLLNEMSEYAFQSLNLEFNKFGIELTNFNFISINIPENDESLIKLKEVKDLAARVKIVGRDIYQMDRSFDVLDKAAQNESGTIGNVMGAGIGLGIGAGIGNQMTNVSNNMNVNTPPPPPMEVEFYILLDNQQNGPFNLNQLRQFVSTGKLTKQTYVWKQGMESWGFAENQSELLNLFQSNNTPPPPPIV